MYSYTEEYVFKKETVEKAVSTLSLSFCVPRFTIVNKFEGKNALKIMNSDSPQNSERVEELSRALAEFVSTTVAEELDDINPPIFLKVSIVIPFC